MYITLNFWRNELKFCMVVAENGLQHTVPSNQNLKMDTMWQSPSKFLQERIIVQWPTIRPDHGTNEFVWSSLFSPWASDSPSLLVPFCYSFIHSMVSFSPFPSVCMCVCLCVYTHAHCLPVSVTLWMCVCPSSVGVFDVCMCICSDDEHMLIQHYCQSLNQGSPLSQPRSPAQILISMETEEKGELERVLGDLEQENRSDFTDL